MKRRLLRLIEPKTNIDSNRKIFSDTALMHMIIKPFGEAVKAVITGRAAIMSSYNYIGSTWSRACPQLQKEVLREEWGFQGMVLSDYFGNYGYMDADRAIRGGTDISCWALPATTPSSPTCFAGFPCNTSSIPASNQLRLTKNPSPLGILPIFKQRLGQAVRDGKISEEIINQRVDEILDVILPVTAAAPLDGRPFDVESHHKMAAKTAGASAMLKALMGRINPSFCQHFDVFA